ncbi:MAG: membrane protease YdiL (CAAX protease family) [Candidatus Krumholzibacteriia bacterium]
MRIKEIFVAARPGFEQRPSALILLTVLVLTPFFYWLRADSIGVSSHTRAWTILTGSELNHITHNVASAIVLGLLPLLVARFCLGLGFRDMGMGLGRWKRGLLWVGIGVPVAILAGWVSAAKPEMRAVYPLNPGLVSGQASFVNHALIQLLYYGSWEILFRGVLLRGLTPRLGFATANMIQMALSVLAHFGRPGTETLSAIPAGLAFGGIAHQTKSVWYVILIHWAVGTAQDAFIMCG